MKIYSKFLILLLVVLASKSLMFAGGSAALETMGQFEKALRKFIEPSGEFQKEFSRVYDTYYNQLNLLEPMRAFQKEFSRIYDTYYNQLKGIVKEADTSRQIAETLILTEGALPSFRKKFEEINQASRMALMRYNKTLSTMNEIKTLLDELALQFSTKYNRMVDKIREMKSLIEEKIGLPPITKG